MRDLGQRDFRAGIAQSKIAARLVETAEAGIYRLIHHHLDHGRPVLGQESAKHHERLCHIHSSCDELTIEDDHGASV